MIVRLSSFGDIVLTEPITRAAKLRYPDSRLWFTTGSQYTGIPRLFSSVDVVVPYEKNAANPDLAEVGSDIDFDAVVDLQNNRHSRRITRSLKARTITRYRRQHLLRFLMVYAPWVWKGPLKHTVESYADAVGHLGIVVDDRVPVITVPQDLVEDLRRTVGPGPFVGICPGGSSRHKRWGTDRFVDLGRRLIDGGQSILAIGAEMDRPIVEALVERWGPATIPAYVGDDVEMVAALLSLCTATVTNDSGLMHLAAGVGSTVVALFGPTSPLLGFAPLAAGTVIVTRDLPCSPCAYHGNRPCKYDSRQCLEEIDAAEVAAILNEIVQRKVVSGDDKRS